MHSWRARKSLAHRMKSSHSNTRPNRLQFHQPTVDKNYTRHIAVKALLASELLPSLAIVRVGHSCELFVGQFFSRLLNLFLLRRRFFQLAGGGLSGSLLGLWF